MSEKQKQSVMKSELESRMKVRFFELSESSALAVCGSVATGLWTAAMIKHPALLSLSCLSVSAGIFGFEAIDTYRNVKEYIKLRQELQNIR